jgi:hypothetical protein
LSKADAEAVASRITEKVRCYGFGPVVLKQDVIAVCDGESERGCMRLTRERFHA